MKIDVHTHILPRHIPRFIDRFGTGGFITLDHIPGSCRARMVRDDGRVFREVHENCFDADARLRDCDSHGVSVQVLSTVPVMFSYWAQAQHADEVARFLNDDIANVVARAPQRFVGLGTLPLQDPERAVKELRRCILELGLRGVQIGSHVQAATHHHNLSDPALFCVFEEAERLGAAIFVHPWDMMGEASMQKYWLPWLVGMPAEVSRAMCSVIFGGLLTRLPNLRWCFAHGGGAFAGSLGRIEHGFYARPDLVAVDNAQSPTQALKAGNVFVDSLVHDADTLAFILQVFGHDAVALGSDYPFPLGEEVPGALIETMASLTQPTKDKLLFQNALRWLGQPTPATSPRS